MVVFFRPVIVVVELVGVFMLSETWSFSGIALQEVKSFSRVGVVFSVVISMIDFSKQAVTMVAFLGVFMLSQTRNFIDTIQQ